MDAIILAAGKAKRFGGIHKTLVQLNDNLSLIEYALIFIKENHITDNDGKIIIVINKDDVYLNGNGKLIHPVINRIEASPHYTNNICFVFQSPDENGPAAGLRAAADKISSDFIILFGDNYYSGNISTMFNQYDAIATYKLIPESKNNLRLAAVDTLTNIIIEKPHNIAYGKFFCGYILSKYENIKYLTNLQKSKRGEYEITDFFNSCQNKGFKEIECNWSDITSYADVPEIIEYIKNTHK